MALYQDLPLEPNQTRVLYLQPSSKLKDPIECRLEVTTLQSSSNSIDFEALSYVWGDLSDRRDIRINDSVVAVTANLEKALRYLRNRKRSRKLWVDAVSINQYDIPERNMQVKLMANIYRDAQKVLVWLGESDTEMEKTIKWMRKELPCGLFETSSGRSAVTGGRAHHPASDIGVQRLVNNSYWHRMWTCQEFALASWDPILICGHNSFEAGYLWPALEAKGLLQDMTTLWSEDGTINNGFTANFPCIQTSILIRHAMIRRGHLPYRLTPSLSLFLSMTSARNCDDPRDKVYALYGLVEHQDTLPRVDYSKPIEDVIKEIVAFLVNERNELDLYSFFGTFSPSEKPNSASWIPNLSDGSLKSPRCPAHFISGDVCSYGGLRFSNPEEHLSSRISSSLTELSIEGLHIDRIRHVIILGNSLSELQAQIRVIQSLLERRASHVRPSIQMQRDQGFVPPIADIIRELGEQDLWKTLAPRFEDFTNDPERESLTQQFQSFQNTPQPHDRRATPSGFTSTHKDLVEALEHMYGRSFFVTESGIFGASVPDVEDGDELVLLYGFKVPYMLRRSRQHIGAESEPFLMIGGAYVSGIMLGELTPIDGFQSHVQTFRII